MNNGLNVAYGLIDKTSRQLVYTVLIDDGVPFYDCSGGLAPITIAPGPPDASFPCVVCEEKAGVNLGILRQHPETETVCGACAASIILSRQPGAQPPHGEIH